MSGVPTEPTDRAARAGVKGWVQVAGFGVGLALLAWCIWLVARDQAKIDQLKRLAASPGTFAVLLALSAGVSLSAGMVFRAVIAPVKRLPVSDVLAVNSVAMLLNLLPFKFGMIARGYIHRTRNGVPVPLIVAWIIATAGVLAVSLLPPILATLVLRRIDSAWWASVVGGTLLLGVCAVVFARVMANERFWSWILSRGAQRPRTLGRFTGSVALAQLREGARMLGNVPAVSQGVAWRTVSMGFGVWRFVIAAGAVGAAMTVGQCVAADSTYFAIQAGAPTGALGAREGGTVAIVASVCGDSLPVVVLAVTAAETASNLLMAGAALAYLKLTSRLECGGSKNTTGESG